MEETVKKLLKFNSKRATSGDVFLVPVFYGPSGCGKTWRAKEIYRDLQKETPGLRWQRILPGTMLPEEVLGLPKVTKEKTVWTAPDWAVSKDPVFLFVDEIDKARPETLAALLTLFAEARVRDRILPQGSMILGAMQPVDRNEWLADETGRAFGARLTYFPMTYDWRFVERETSLEEGSLNFLPVPGDLDPPVSEKPNPRQISYISAISGLLESKALERCLQGIVQKEYINPLLEAIKNIDPGIRCQSMISAIKEDPKLIDKMSVSELTSILPHTWLDSPTMIKEVYKAILIRGNPEDIVAAQEGIYEFLKDLCEQNGGSCEIMKDYEITDLAEALNNMAKEVGDAWIERAKKDKKTKKSSS